MATAPRHVDRYPGMGAIVHCQGVAFRVWAPNASTVSVIGDFNQWSAETDPMELTDKPGTFRDAIEKLSHLKRLGINVVQVMPVAEFAGDY